MLTAVLRVCAARPGGPAVGARTRSLWRDLPEARRDPLVALRQLAVVDSSPALSGDRGDDGIDPAQGVGPTGGGVRVGGLPQCPAGDIDGAVAVEVRAPTELDDGASVEAPGAGGDVLPLLVAPTGDVEVPQPATAATAVVPGEDGDDGEPHHRRLKVAADHRCQLIGLAFEAERRPLDLLVVLEL